MTNLDINSSSTDSSSGSSSDSSSSGSSSSSSGSASSSSDSDSSSDTPVTTAPPDPKSPKPVSEEPVKKKEEKVTRSTVTKIISSSEDEAPPNVAKAVQARRRSSAKTKANTTPAKHSRQSPRQVNEKSKPPAKSSKPIANNDIQNSLKKKSIFSPDNSSDSESEGQKSNSKTIPTRSKGKQQKNIKEKPQSPKKTEEIKENGKLKNGRASATPTRKGGKSKDSATSCTSSQSSSDTADSSGSDVKKQSETKSSRNKSGAKNNSKLQNSTPTKNSVPELDSVASMPRKLTRSLSARVSRLANASRPTNTDTDSDGDERNDKGVNAKKVRRTIKSPLPKLMPLDPPEPQERRCPVRGCDSSGHLGGLSEKHFTWDACPVYHNVSPAWCVAANEERASAGEARSRAVANMQHRPRSQPTIEQRAYQLKVKDMRSKWKGSQEFREKMAVAGGSDDMNEEREPLLDSFVPDYDLRLFREAQAMAAIQIENELGDIASSRGTRFVVMGKYMMEVWYQSPYPGEAYRVPRLFVCEFCLNHHSSATGANRHVLKCKWRHPPGDEVYRKDNLSVWQVDGRKHKLYCQQLCLLAKFFLDHKTLYYDVEPFLFYVMTVADSDGCHIVGYFSKEKNSFLNYNVSCILTLPPYQRQGYGRLLIDFSYLLTKVEGKVGSPETPLSDLGLISYRSYWKEALLKRLCSAPGPALCIRDLSKDLAIASCDIVSTLQERGLMKYWKGKHIVLKKQDVLEDVSRRAERVRCVDPLCLRWTPPNSQPPR